MAQFLTPGILQVENAGGAPLNGAKLHVYQSGTTTPLALFSDETLETGIPNPLVADASGAFPEAFLAETKCKLILTTSAGVTVWTRNVVYTTGVADNIPASGVSFDGATSGLASDNVQSAIDEIVELQGLTQSWTNSADGVIATGESTNAGAAGGPDIDLYRNSASPAASDVIGGIRLTGENAAGDKETYAKVHGVILDTTNGSEDAKIVVQTMVAGALADRLHIGSGIWTDTATGGDKGAGTLNISGLAYRNGGALIPLLHIQDQKAANTAGGTFTSGAWQTRTLSTEVTDEIGSTLSSNQFTLPAGTYEIEASAPGVSCGGHVAKLRNITDSADTLIGTAEVSATSVASGCRSLVTGRFTIAATKTFELQHRCSSTQASNGFGNAANAGVIEVYADVRVWRFA